MDDLPIKIQCKKLHSGKCKVNFSVDNYHFGRLQGYLLANPQDRLKDVMNYLQLNLKMKWKKHTDLGYPNTTNSGDDHLVNEIFYLNSENKYEHGK